MIMKKEFKITAVGKNELEAELAELKGRRGSIADKIAEARGFGDLSENAEYDVAREEQGVVETRIAEIEEILKNAKIIKAKDSTKIAVGSCVELTQGNKTVSYTIVGKIEANPIEGKISDESPIGIALLGKQVGDTVDISTTKNKITYKIVKIC